MPERQFILSCESTVDLPYAYVAGRDIPILFYSYMIDGETYIDDMGRDPSSIPTFYRRLDAGALPTTAQLNAVQYEEFLEPLLQKGDVLHIVFGTGMTSSYQGALLAAETLLLHVSMDARVADVMLEYVISGMVAVYQQWFLSGRRDPIELVSETLSTLAFSGINALMGPPKGAGTREKGRDEGA